MARHDWYYEPKEEMTDEEFAAWREQQWQDADRAYDLLRDLEMEDCNGAPDSGHADHPDLRDGGAGRDGT